MLFTSRLSSVENQRSSTLRNSRSLPIAPAGTTVVDRVPRAVTGFIDAMPAMARISFRPRSRLRWAGVRSVYLQAVTMISTR